MKKQTKEHLPWPYNPALLFCPGTGQYHHFGCACVRANPDLLPASIRDWYRQNWPQTSAAAG